jgi:hypothetical protein
MPVTAVAETLEIDATTSIAVSDIVLAEDGITYVRQIDFYIDDLAITNRRPALTVRVTSDAQATLKLTVPSGVTF